MPDDSTALKMSWRDLMAIGYDWNGIFYVIYLPNWDSVPFSRRKKCDFFIETRRKIQLDDQPLLITRFNFDPGMDK